MKNIISKLKRKFDIFINVFHDIFDVYCHNKYFEFVDLIEIDENFDDDEKKMKILLLSIFKFTFVYSNIIFSRQYFDNENSRKRQYRIDVVV